jgi:pentapeptide MXKDX repeat protein
VKGPNKRLDYEKRIVMRRGEIELEDKLKKDKLKKDKLKKDKLKKDKLKKDKLKKDKLKKDKLKTRFCETQQQSRSYMRF